MRKLFFLLCGVVFFAIQAMAQRTVTGKVTNEKGNPVPNASVLVKGTTTGTVTKSDGTYSLVVPANARSLNATSFVINNSEIVLLKGICQQSCSKPFPGIVRLKEGFMVFKADNHV